MPRSSSFRRLRNPLCMILWFITLSAVLAAAASARAGDDGADDTTWDEPLWVGEELIYPEGGNYPRSMTVNERRFVDELGLHVQTRAVTPPPTGPIRSVAEYEPMAGALLSWRGTSAQNNVLAQMARWITTTGNARVYLMVSSTSQATALSTIQTAGADMTKVIPLNGTTDTIWIRDYGPRYCYEGNVRVIVDHTYNRPRPNDNAQPSWFANYKKHERYEHQLVHGGGNFHLSAAHNGSNPAGRLGFATVLIDNENPGVSQSQIINIWNQYQNLNTTLTAAFPTSVDSTQHIDMWMQIIGDNTIVISDWPTQSGSTQDNICDNMAASLTAQGWTVYRTPAVRVTNGTTGNPSAHYTYTNVVMMNNVVLVPSYTASSTSTYNDQARDVYAAALPGKTIVQVASQALVTSSGVMHCVMMHVPVNLGGANPTAYLRNYRGGQTLTTGQPITLNFITDDDNAVVNVDVRLSTDSGQTFPIVLASAIANTGSFDWTPPSNINSAHGRVRIIARDAQNNTGFDQSDSDIVIGTPTPPCAPADINCDGTVGVPDLLAVIANWGACAGTCPPACTADIAPQPNGDCTVGVADLLMVISNWG